MDRVIPQSPIGIIKVEEADRYKNKFTDLAPSKDSWKRGEVNFSPGSLICFADGSRTKSGHAGAGAYLAGRGIGRLYPLGSLATVFQAEMYAIMEIARMEEVTKSMEETVHICSDSLAALRALNSTRNKCPLVQECRKALDGLRRNKKLVLTWVPGHIGIPGSDRADQLAKIAAREPFMGPEPALGTTREYIGCALHEWRLATMGESWKKHPGCRQSKLMIAGPDREKATKLLGLSREELRLLVGILTGHCGLNRHLSVMGVKKDPICPMCGLEEEDTQHYLGECTVYLNLRLAIFGEEVISEEELSSLQPLDILAYIKRSGRFKRGA